MKEIREESKCLASLAVFRELYNSEKDIYAIICEFLREIITTNGKYQFTLTEITTLLNETYDFKILEAVVSTSLNRFKDSLIKTDGLYTITNKESFNITGKLTNKHTEIQRNNTTIITNLFKFIEEERNEKLSDDEKGTITHAFCSFIIDETSKQDFSEYISAFIVKEKRNSEFTTQLNTIKEGVVLYTGLKYNNSLNELGSWNTELTIFLETEILFHFAGLNGKIYQLLFNDLFSLIKEINQSSTSKNGKRLIHLKYFSDVKNDIESFFKKAEYIVAGKDKANPSKTAMTTILDGCTTPADVIAKKSQFYDLLKQNLITEDDYTQYYSENNHKYNIEDETLLKDLSSKYEIEEVAPYLRFLNFINIHRRGNSSFGFDRVGSVLLSGTRNTLLLAWDESIKPNGNVPLASNLSFLTNKFWVKLNKGFGKGSLPKSFDIVTKAQIVLSTQLNDTVGDKFDELQNKFKKGQLTEKDAISTIAKLRNEAKKPEDINEDNIESILSSIEESSIEFHLKEQELFKQKAIQQEIENSELKKNLKNAEILSQEKEVENIKTKAELDKYKKAERENNLIEFQNSKWTEFQKGKRQELKYCVAINLMTFMPIIIGVIIKVTIDEWLKSIGNHQWWIWEGLAIITLIELFGRSYIFNKEKVKSGWLWLITSCSKTQIGEVKTQKFNEFKAEFDKQNNS